MKLDNGSRVVIVGGGPAGCFSALHLLHHAAEAGLNLDLTIFEPRVFNRPGPGGCNKCAGILSSNLIHNLEKLDLHLPLEVIQSELVTYILHFNGQELPIHRPDPNHRLVSVYRGSGPRMGIDPTIASFDGWLLEQARKRGANIRQERVQNIRPGPGPVVVTARQQYPADLVVLATGVNTRAPLDPSWEYHAPRTEIMAQDEVPLPVGFPNDCVHIFFDHPPGLIFGALIPKGRYANIPLLVHESPPDAVNDFLEGHRLLEHFSTGYPGLCGCMPRVAIAPASNYFADRMVAVGDAAATRLYKDGIGAAFITAQAAARTAIRRGVSRADFAAGYLPTCQRIANDNRFGRLLFKIWAFNRRSAALSNIWQLAVQAESDQPPTSQVHTRVLWGMFSGSESYRQLFWLSFSLQALSGLWQSARLNWRLT